ncbi:MAG TPA: DUF1302 family protein, partial [Verrucomicrobiae bacterium]|nr:DUF1302 family protein [Verrucomicrobiae bacterium]
MTRGLGRFAALPLALVLSAPAIAIEYEIGDGISLKMINKVTIGAGVRTQDRHIDDLGKLNTPGQQELCKDDDCLSFGIGSAFDRAPNQRLVDARGGYFLHASDDGDMNYERGDLVTGVTKFSGDWTLNWGEWTFKTNFTGYYDVVNAGFETIRFNTVRCTGANPSRICTGDPGPNASPDNYLLGSDTRPRSGEVESRLAVKGEFREYFVTRTFALGDYEVFATLGSQRLRWGEANLTLFNTLDVINPQDAVLARQPGLALNELNLPTPLFNVGSDLFEGLTVDAWYQLEWQPVRPEPAGSFFSNLTDAAGGGEYAVIAEGQYPEDPDGLWFSTGVTGLISNSHRTVFLPDEGFGAARNEGQFGLRAKWYLPDFNNGTELGFYFANYHSRLPYASVIATPDSCLRNATNFAAALTMCQGLNAASNRGQGAVLEPVRCDPRVCDADYLEREPLPIDRLGVFLDYPENIQMYGVSFNTTAGGWSFAGEYAYRPNLPAQVLLSDVVFAGLQPAIGREQLPFTDVNQFNPANATPEVAARFATLLQDFAAYSAANPGEDASASALPSASTIFPSYIADYRGFDNSSAATDINGGQYIPGYE